MERQKIKQYIEKYSSELERALHEPIVDRDAGQLPMDTAKAFFLLLPMLNGERWTERLNTAAIAVGAVHAAFDAHDTIDVSDATSKQQQLTVLSGDYFSGVHYRLLASIPELGFIQSLSQTIGRINEVKTTLHQQLPDEPEQLIEAVRIIEAGCITDFLHTFGFSRYVMLANAALPLLCLEDGNGAKTSHATQLLHDELREALQASDFLEPFLQQEIRSLALPLSRKIELTLKK
ncbi:heptaprenyl diphosphate synthase component 1 [Sporosarcina sp. YIM B06819]|uniref:heptaprenyl diphosphate synthase component 1 n=1 Tax=Sporosarcina sp. YIM B06819 TaxID=3081769 RepID=UPI00298C6551|nr:heptaprenyl diphosphate synthase component 1 [Sporosarcina sp. YIM B06819]